LAVSHLVVRSAFSACYNVCVKVGLDFGASLMDEVMKALNMSDVIDVTVESPRDAAAAAAAAADDDDDDDDDTVSGDSSSSSTQTDSQQLDDDIDDVDTTCHVIHSTLSVCSILHIYKRQKTPILSTKLEPSSNLEVILNLSQINWYVASYKHWQRYNVI